MKTAKHCLPRRRDGAGHRRVHAHGRRAGRLAGLGVRVLRDGGPVAGVVRTVAWPGGRLPGAAAAWAHHARRTGLDRARPGEAHASASGGAYAAGQNDASSLAQPTRW